VTARTADGQIAHDLTADEFGIHDGVRQEIHHFGHEETPISVLLLFDKSGAWRATSSCTPRTPSAVCFPTATDFRRIGPVCRILGSIEASSRRIVGGFIAN
jgi:hypothetical protein